MPVFFKGFFEETVLPVFFETPFETTVLPVFPVVTDAVADLADTFVATGLEVFFDVNGLEVFLPVFFFVVKVFPAFLVDLGLTSFLVGAAGVAGPRSAASAEAPPNINDAAINRASNLRMFVSVLLMKRHIRG